MYKRNRITPTSITVTKSYEGETIEAKIRRITTNKEPIKDNADLIYTERKDGVQPQYDIRTDRFEIAVEAMDKVTKSGIAKREMNIGDKGWENMTNEQRTEHVKKYPGSKYKEWKPETGNSTSDLQ
ncbi:MAG: hypothetical protein [Microviridae sp.]|nr:MAG: hypothetical protein [Microviridae sp.]